MLGHRYRAPFSCVRVVARGIEMFSTTRHSKHSIFFDGRFEKNRRSCTGSIRLALMGDEHRSFKKKKTRSFSFLCLDSRYHGSAVHEERRRLHIVDREWNGLPFPWLDLKV